MGSLTQTVVINADDVDLTTVGAVDWSAWANATSLVAYDWKSGGGHTIPDPTILGDGGPNGYSGDGRTLSWTDGTNHTGYDSDSGIYGDGDATGAGFQLILPADTNIRTVYVYISGYSDHAPPGFTVTSSLSDGSASTQTDSTTLRPAYDAVDAYIKLVYQANSSGQTLTLKWYISDNGNSNVTLNGAALASVVSSGGGDVTAALTGASMALSRGVLVPKPSFALTGRSIASAKGSIVPASSKALTGAVLASSAGSLANSRAVTLSGLAAALAEGSLTVPSTVFADLIGLSLASAAGSLSPAPAIALPGAALALAGGAVAVRTDFTRTLTGQSATVAAGVIAPAASSALVGQDITSAEGTLTASPSAVLTGAAAVTTAGAIGPQSSAALAGEQLTSSGGTVAPGMSAGLAGQAVSGAAANFAPTASIQVAGLAASFTGGVVSTLGEIVMQLTGLSITSALGTLSPAAAAGLTGDGMSAAGGSVSAAAAVALTGISASALYGSMSIPSVTVLAGLRATAAAGAAVPSLSIALTGHAAAFAYGQLTAVGGFVVQLTGLALTIVGGHLSPVTVAALTGSSTAVASGNVVASISQSLLGQSAALAGSSLGTGRSLVLTGRPLALVFSALQPSGGDVLYLVGDPRYTVSFSAARDVLVTAPVRNFTISPQGAGMDIKGTEEKIPLLFDFSADLVDDETLTGGLTVEITLSPKSKVPDPDPEAIANGTATLDTTNKHVVVPVQAGVNGGVYRISVTAETTNPKKVLTLVGYLPVRDA